MANISIQAITTLLVDTPEDGCITLGDIREFIQKADQFNLPDDLEMLDCVLAVEIPIKDIDVISCGEHVGEAPLDIIVYTHKCLEVPVDQPLWFEPSGTIVKEMGIS